MIESFNGVIKKAIRSRKFFPHDDSTLKVVFYVEIHIFEFAN